MQGIIEDLDDLTSDNIYSEIVKQSSIFKIKTDGIVNSTIRLDNTPALHPIESFVENIRSTKHIGYTRKDVCLLYTSRCV